MPGFILKAETLSSIRGSNGRGGGIACFSGSPSTSKFANNTVCNNAVTGGSGEGGALFISNSSTPDFHNCIFSGNSASTGNAVFINEEPSDPDFYYSIVEGGSSAFGLNGTFYLGTYQNNLDTDPMFVAPSAGSSTGFNGVTADWSLQSGRLS